MRVTEKEAKEKLCPNYDQNGTTLCVATGCMAWRWVNAPMADISTGYCGLAGRPEEFIGG